MKFLAFSSFLFVQSQQQQNSERETRRYNQLALMMKTYWPQFDEKKFWGYGCQCLNTNDRPMSSMGIGMPIDNLDRHCQQYKQCQKCTKEFMGQQCIGEFVQYGFDRKRNQISCTDSPGSCERMVCECDLQFAKGIKKAVQSYDDRNHRFNGFKPDKRCQKRSGPGLLKCCPSLEGPNALYGPSKQCCPGSGEVISIGDQCSY